MYSVAASNLIESLRGESAMVGSCCKWIMDVLKPVVKSHESAEETEAAKDPSAATDTSGAMASTPSYDTANVANSTPGSSI